MDYEFWVISPSLKLNTQTQDIKKSILIKNRQSPLKLKVTDDDFATFAPRLESDWGSIHASLPGFHTGLLSGTWRGREAQSVPTSLLGDFGEFISAEVFRSRFAPRARVARVVRPAGLQRPDFLIFDSKTKKITALESKASTTNARRLWNKIRSTGKTNLTVCSTLNARRTAGLDQIADSVQLVKRIANSRRGMLVRATAKYGRARIPAHRSAIATPYFLDGRAVFDREVDPNKLVRPRKCGIPCTQCLVHKNEPVLLCPMFFNESTLVEPLDPGQDPEAFFNAYIQSNLAIWLDSQELYKRAWDNILKALDNTALFVQKPFESTQPLLDLIERGIELDLVENPQSALNEINVRIRRSTQDNDTIEDALTLHESEGRKDPFDHAAEGLDDNSPTLGLGQEPLLLEANNPTGRRSKNVPIAGTEVGIVSRQYWSERRELFRTKPRRELQQIYFTESGITWDELDSFLRRQPGSRILLKLYMTQDRQAWLHRGPLVGRDRSDLQLGAERPEFVREALTTLLAIAQSKRVQRPWRELTESVSHSLRILGVPDERQYRLDTSAENSPLMNARMDDDGFGWIEYRFIKTP